MKKIWNQVQGGDITAIFVAFVKKSFCHNLKTNSVISQGIYSNRRIFG